MTSELHLVVMAARRMDSAPTTFLTRVTARQTTCPFACGYICVPTKRDREVGGSGLRTWDSKASASSIMDTWWCPRGRLSSGSSHVSSWSHRSMASRKSAPHFWSLGRGPSSGRSTRCASMARMLQLVPREAILLCLPLVCREQQILFLLLLLWCLQHGQEHTMQVADNVL